MSARNKILIFSTVVIILAGVIVYFVILPTVNDIKTISGTIYRERVDLEKKYQRGQLLKKIIADFEEIKPKQDKLNSIFIVSNNELEFITALESLATYHALAQNIRLEPLKDDNQQKDFYPLPLGITTQGEFTKTLKYLRDLERLDYYVNISTINIKASGKDSRQNSLITATLDGKIYALATKDEKN